MITQRITEIIKKPVLEEKRKQGSNEQDLINRVVTLPNISSNHLFLLASLNSLFTVSPVTIKLALFGSLNQLLGREEQGNLNDSPSHQDKFMMRKTQLSKRKPRREFLKQESGNWMLSEGKIHYSIPGLCFPSGNFHSLLV